MSGIWQDIRYTLRMTCKTPGFAMAAVCALALGIGANTTIFSAINALLLHPFSFRDMDHLAIIWESRAKVETERNAVAFGNYLDVKSQNAAFDSVAAVMCHAFRLRYHRRPASERNRKEKIMLFIKSLMLGCLLGLVMFCFVFPTRAQAQANKPADSAEGDRDQTLKQLLTEVRELRLAVQRATVSNTQFQMLIERIRAQQAHVDALSRQSENIHSQVVDMKAAKPQMEQQIKDAEDLLDRTPDPSAHADLESRIKAGKANLVRLAQEDERVRNREASLDTELQAAQAKLNELNSQLDSLVNGLKGP